MVVGNLAILIPSLLLQHFAGPPAPAAAASVQRCRPPRRGRHQGVARRGADIPGGIPVAGGGRGHDGRRPAGGARSAGRRRDAPIVRAADRLAADPRRPDADPSSDGRVPARRRRQPRHGVPALRRRRGTHRERGGRVPRGHRPGVGRAGDVAQPLGRSAVAGADRVHDAVASGRAPSTPTCWSSRPAACSTRRAGSGPALG